MLKIINGSFLVLVFGLLSGCGGGSGGSQQITITDSGSGEVSVAMGIGGELLFPEGSLPRGSSVQVTAVEYPPLGENFEALGQAYEISVETQPVMPVRVTLPIPAGQQTGNLSLIRVHDEGVIEILQTEVQDGNLVARTSGFSILLAVRLQEQLEDFNPQIIGPSFLPVGVAGQYQETALSGEAGIVRKWTLSVSSGEGELYEVPTLPGNSAVRVKATGTGLALLAVKFRISNTVFSASAYKPIQIVEQLDSFEDGLDLTIYGPDLVRYAGDDGSQSEPFDVTARILNTDVDQVISWNCQIDPIIGVAEDCGSCTENCNKVFNVENLVVKSSKGKVKFTARALYNGSLETFGEAVLDVEVINDRPVITSLTGNTTDRRWTPLLNKFDFNVSATVEGGKSSYLYVWALRPTNQQAIHELNEKTDNFQFSVREPGIYRLELEVTDSNGEKTENEYPLIVQTHEDYQHVLTHIKGAPEDSVEVNQELSLEIAANGSFIIIDGKKVDYVYALDWGDGSEYEIARISAENSTDGGIAQVFHRYAEIGDYRINLVARPRWHAGADFAVRMLIAEAVAAGKEKVDRSQTSVEIRVQRSLPVVDVTAIDDSADEEGQDTAEFVFNREGGDMTQPLRVRFEFSGTAEPVADFNAPAYQFITIPANELSASLLLTPTKDNVADEGEETVVLSLVDDGAYNIGTPAQAVATIADFVEQPVLVSIVASDAQAAEKGQKSGQFTLTRSGDLSKSLRVYLTLEGSASRYVDFNLSPGFDSTGVTFSEGQDTIDIVVTPKDDARVDEGEETVEISIKPSSWFYSIGASAFATVFIADRGPVVYVKDRTVFSKSIYNWDACLANEPCLEYVYDFSGRTQNDRWDLQEGFGSYTFKYTRNSDGVVLADYAVSFEFDAPPAQITSGTSYPLNIRGDASGYTDDRYLVRSFKYFLVREGERDYGNFLSESVVGLSNRDMPYNDASGRFEGTLTGSSVTQLVVPNALDAEITVGGWLGHDPAVRIEWIYRLEE